MPRKTVHDPHWEPYSALVKLYVTPSQRHDLDQLVTELRVSRSLLVRLAIEAGLPDVVADLRRRRRAALRPGGRTRGRRSAVPSVRRGPSGARDVVDVWRQPSEDEPAEPERLYPLSDEDRCSSLREAVSPRFPSPL